MAQNLRDQGGLAEIARKLAVRATRVAVVSSHPSRVRRLCPRRKASLEPPQLSSRVQRTDYFVCRSFPYAQAARAAGDTSTVRDAAPIAMTRTKEPESAPLTEKEAPKRKRGAEAKKEKKEKEKKSKKDKKEKKEKKEETKRSSKKAKTKEKPSPPRRQDPSPSRSRGDDDSDASSLSSSSSSDSERERRGRRRSRREESSEEEDVEEDVDDDADDESDSSDDDAMMYDEEDVSEEFKRLREAMRKALDAYGDVDFLSDARMTELTSGKPNKIFEERRKAQGMQIGALIKKMLRKNLSLMGARDSLLETSISLADDLRPRQAADPTVDNLDPANFQCRMWDSIAKHHAVVFGRSQAAIDSVENEGKSTATDASDEKETEFAKVYREAFIEAYGDDIDALRRDEKTNVGVILRAIQTGVDIVPELQKQLHLQWATLKARQQSD